jgi:diguanylate cyclase (GGDEF)-like protein
MYRFNESLYNFHKELNRPFNSLSEIVVYALDIMLERLQLDQITFFRWYPDDMLLLAKHACRKKSCMEYTENIFVELGSSLYKSLELEEHYVSKSLKSPALYVPIRWEGLSNRKGLYAKGARVKKAGAIRCERFNESMPFSEQEIELIKGFAQEFSGELSNAEQRRFSQRQLRRANALTELSAIFASSLRLEDSLGRILQGIQKYFGFDRVRLYLVDRENNKLKGELSVEVRGNIRALANDVIDLEKGSHVFADAVLESVNKNPWPVLDDYKDTIVYLPLTIQSKTVGLLVVDNFLSQRSIIKDDLVALSSFAGQIGLAIDNAVLFDKVQDLSQYDELTTLPRRRYFMERFGEEIYRSERFAHPMGLIWMDIDHFKGINDTYGHQIGDVILREISKVILKNIRKIDFPCRYGGDEILILLPRAKPAEAKAISARLSREVKKLSIEVPFSRSKKIKVSVSQGIANFPNDAKTSKALLRKADDALYWVKSHGRGGYAVYSELAKKELSSK